ncbi:MAG TPA: MarR family transcriptional regulator [Pseudonocardiaceae bacterium]|jgi:DNA-binding MarR family transcriptional regulator|nr:MarR family transcriptional regulator [Pseudonocardiaceae bacterium]
MTADTAPGSAHPSAAPDDTALQLVLALHRLVRSLRRPSGLHPTQLLVLAQLVEAGPQRIGELAARVPCSQPTATTVANGLEVDGLVRRVRDTSDGRAIRLQITEAGRAAVLDVVRDQAALLRSRLDSLSEADVRRVGAAVPVLRAMSSPD